MYEVILLVVPVLLYLAILIAGASFWFWGAILILLALYSGKRRNWFHWMSQFLIGKRRGEWSAGFAATWWLLVLCMMGAAPFLFINAIGNVLGGDMHAIWGLLIWGAATLGEFLMLHFLVKGEEMPSIFDIVKDKPALEAFVSNTEVNGIKPPARVNEINPENLARRISEEVIGQDAIVRDVAGQIARRIRLARTKKPIGVFMFVGATGAGKTELAKAIAKYAFEGRLTRVDCNELTAEHSVQRLIGAPPGYIGSESGGQLTRDIQRLGSGVILLDEIEKAHEATLRTLMGLMDEGRLTEASTGQVMDASQFVIVITSNAEHAALAEIAETIADPDDRRRAVRDTLTGVFRPEQLARIDDIHCFAHLDRRALVQVVGKFLFGFAKDTGVELVNVDSTLLVDTVIRHEKSAKYGIRELIRLVERAIVDGMLDRRAEGFRRVEIISDGTQVEVIGVRDHDDVHFVRGARLEDLRK